MNKTELTKIIRHIVTETINTLKESHQRGEWWIDETGQLTYCDNQVSDVGHEAVATQYICSEILGHFNIFDEELEKFSNYENLIKDTLIDAGRLTEDELASWDNEPGAKYAGPAEVIIEKLIEDKLYSDHKQAEDAVFIAYGSNQRDPRNYAMKYLNWKIMKTYGKYIEIQTWTLTPNDLKIIVHGIWDILNEPEDEDESEIEGDKYIGPRLNVTVQSSGKRFSNIPLEVLEKNMPAKLQAYQSGVQVGYNENINESFHHLHKEYRLYEAHNHIIAMFDDNSKLQFEVNYKNAHGIDKEKVRRKAFSKWKSIASKLHNDKQLSEVGNPIEKSWKECFQEALQDPDLIPFIRTNQHQKIYENKN